LAAQPFVVGDSLAKKRLPANLSPERGKYKAGKRFHHGAPSNPLIAGVFWRLLSSGLIEQWGRGTQKIVDWCLATGQPTRSKPYRHLSLLPTWGACFLGATPPILVDVCRA